MTTADSTDSVKSTTGEVRGIRCLVTERVEITILLDPGEPFPSVGASVEVGWVE